MESSTSSEKLSRKPVRIWTDGCFDMMHYGHANALRQAKALGDYLVVGVHSDEEITKNKGPPVMNEEERYKAVAACKWVDEVVKAAPYVTSLEMLSQYDIDYCVHGDDIVTSADGTDTYHEVKKAGKFKTVPRTRGVSTTDMVGRMLLMTRERESDDKVDSKDIDSMSQGSSRRSPYTGVSKFSTTNQRIVQFSKGVEPGPNDKIVYIDGIFDLFHIGHIEVIKKARELGDYLLVGIHSDREVATIKGRNSIMNLHERVLSVLSCKYVDEVLMEAPYVITKEMIDGLKINVVVHGSVVDEPLPENDPYAVPKKMGIFQTVESPSPLTTTAIVERIYKNRLQYEARNKKKEAKELAELEIQK